MDLSDSRQGNALQVLAFGILSIDDELRLAALRLM
jgi:hypothetical protein